MTEPVCCAFPGSVFTRCFRDRVCKTSNSSLDEVCAKSRFKSNSGSNSSQVGRTLAALPSPTAVSLGTNRLLPREMLLGRSTSSADLRFLHFCCVFRPLVDFNLDLVMLTHSDRQGSRFEAPSLTAPQDEVFAGC